MRFPNQTATLEDLNTRSDEVIDELRSSGRPVFLELGGEEVILQAAKAYDSLLQQVERAEAIAGIRRGLSTMDRQEGSPAKGVLDGIRRKYDIPTDA